MYPCLLREHTDLRQLTDCFFDQKRYENEKDDTFLTAVGVPLRKIATNRCARFSLGIKPLFTNVCVRKIP